jgi:hypothetical protein
MNGVPYFARKLADPKSLPNKNEHVQARAETNERNFAQRVGLALRTDIETCSLKPVWNGAIRNGSFAFQIFFLFYTCTWNLNKVFYYYHITSYIASCCVQSDMTLFALCTLFIVSYDAITIFVRMLFVRDAWFLFKIAALKIVKSSKFLWCGNYWRYLILFKVSWYSCILLLHSNFPSEILSPSASSFPSSFSSLHYWRFLINS